MLVWFSRARAPVSVAVGKKSAKVADFFDIFSPPRYRFVNYSKCGIGDQGFGLTFSESSVTNPKSLVLTLPNA